MQEQPHGSGSYLQEQRRLRQIPLETVARITRISMSNLRHIETENWECLPQPVFVKSFLRTFAAAIGVDPAAVLKRYEADLDRADHQNDVRRRPVAGQHFWLRFCLAILGLLVFIGGTLYFYQWQSQGDPAAVADAVTPTEVKESGTAVAQGAAATAAGAAAAKSAADAEAAAEVRSAPYKGLTLVITAVGTTHVKVIADAAKPERLQLNAGDEQTLVADSHFSLLIDDATAVQLTFNGRAVVLPPKSGGQPLTLQLP